MKEGGCEKEKEVRREGGSDKGEGEEGQREGVRQRGGERHMTFMKDFPSSFQILITLITYSDYSVANAKRKLHTSDLLKHCTVISCLRFLCGYSINIAAQCPLHGALWFKLSCIAIRLCIS